MSSITHIVDDEKVLNEYEYDAWGEVVSQKETVENRFKFNGQQLDPITQQYYLRARFYNPVIARFTQEDTYRGDGLNLYAYCRNNPTYYVDPTGNMCETGARRVLDTVNSRTATKSDFKDLSSYVREKVRKGEVLSDSEKSFYNKIHPKVKNSNQLKEFDIVPYGEFKNFPGDNLTGHELLQNAWLEANNKIPKRGQGISKDNPAIALYEAPIHKYISAAQKSLGLNKNNLTGISWSKNVLINAQIMKEAGVPSNKIVEHIQKTRQFAIDNNL